ncbi:unnamed protein product [Strongylus vulgaris]|uniref:Uncharacterized protein n=1 Tax=Strongylus vulgaris TaxID=40348 RepID=A0A3P7LE40_STRVU|nr:unnamed protein product [Strongylus vulgaris]
MSRVEAKQSSSKNGKKIFRFESETDKIPLFSSSRIGKRVAVKDFGVDVDDLLHGITVSWGTEVQPSYSSIFETSLLGS